MPSATTAGPVPAILRRAAALLLAAACTGAAAGTSETVFFLADDLSSATVYFSNRYEEESDPYFLFPTDYGRSLVLYARPENYSWQPMRRGGQEYRGLQLPGTTSYAYLQRLPERADFLVQRGPTSYTLKVHGSNCVGEGCLQDETIISVVMPKRFKVTQYGGSPRGTWKIVDNTYTYYARRLEGGRVEIDFEDLYAATFASVNASMTKLKGVEVRNVEGTIRIVMPMDNVFASGSVAMSTQGGAWVKSLASALKGAALREVRVEGHADNAPIRSATFPSNWELSAARAAQVVRVLMEEGLPAQKLMAAGLADSRPIARATRPRRGHATGASSSPWSRRFERMKGIRMKHLLLLAAVAAASATLPAAAQPTERALAESPAPAAPSARPAEPRTAVDPKLLPADEVALAEVDTAFKRWGATWMFDRYLPGTARATERGLTGQTYMLRGAFAFARSGQRITIPFAAAYARTGERYALAKLCYNDVSSGMTDCISPGDSLEARQAAAAQTRQMMGAIVLLGMAAALSSTQETCVRRTTFFGETYLVCD